MRQRMSRILAALVIVALALPLTAPATVARPTDTPADLGVGVLVSTASDAGMDKVHPNLRSKVATAAADEEFHIILRVKNGVDITGYLREPLVRPFSDDGLTTVYGYIKAAWLPKLANVDAVDVILPVEGVHEPPRYRDTGCASQGGHGGTRRRRRRIAAWHDVLDTHKSTAAWDKGYTGEGVRVAVLDSGVDFGHPRPARYSGSPAIRRLCRLANCHRLLVTLPEGIRLLFWLLIRSKWLELVCRHGRGRVHGRL